MAKGRTYPGDRLADQTQGSRHYSFLILDTNIASAQLRKVLLEMAHIERDMRFETQHLFVFAPLLYAEQYSQAFQPELRTAARTVSRKDHTHDWISETMALMNDPTTRGLLWVSPLLPSETDIIGPTEGKRELTADDRMLDMVRKTLRKHKSDIMTPAKQEKLKHWFEAADKAGLLPAATTPGFPDLSRPLANQMSELLLAVMFTDPQVQTYMKLDHGDRFKFNMADESVANLCSYLAHAVREGDIDPSMFDFTMMSLDQPAQERISKIAGGAGKMQIKQVDFLGTMRMIRKSLEAMQKEIDAHPAQYKSSNCADRIKHLLEVEMEHEQLVKQTEMRTRPTGRSSYLLEQRLIQKRAEKNPEPHESGKGDGGKGRGG